jgi:hypothetical protein
MPQAWDVENRLTSVSGGASATFVYDGDALRDRVKGTVGGVTTYYVGNYYEYNVSTSVATSYYYAGGTRVAMRQAGAVYYLHADHLGSTSLVTCGSAGGCKGMPYQGVLAEQLYMPYGAPRWTSGTLPTDYRFTG